MFRCWYPVGTELGRDALERNLAQHLPATEAAVTGSPQAAAAVEEISSDGDAAHAGTPESEGAH